MSGDDPSSGDDSRWNDGPNLTAMSPPVSARVYRWRDQPPLPAVPPPGPVDIATWRLLWRVYAIRPARVEMMARHLGLRGGVPQGPAQLGRDYRLSRARVREVYATAARAARKVGAPVSLACLAQRMSVMPVRYEQDVLARLVADGLLAEPLTLQALGAVADLYGVVLPKPEVLGVVDGRRLVCAPDQAAAVRGWRSRLVVATMILPVRVADLPPPRQVPPELVAPLLRADPRLECSDERSAGTVVVWRRDRLSSAGDIMVGMLRAGPQTVSALLDAIHLRYAHRYAVPEFTPPSGEALRAYLRAQPWASVDGDRVTLTGPSPTRLRRMDRVFLDAYVGSEDPDP